MLKNLIIRRARDKDIGNIKGVLKSAFYRFGKNEFFNEWEFADRVRREPGFIPELCFVAVIEDNIVGYNLLTKAMIGDHRGLALGPLAIKPEYQGQGIGKKLVEFSLEHVKKRSFKWVVLIGGDYYTQFGFEAGSRYGVVLSDNHPENAYIKIKFIDSNRQVSGTLRYCDSFYDENGCLL